MKKPGLIEYKERKFIRIKQRGIKGICNGCAFEHEENPLFILCEKEGEICEAKKDGSMLIFQEIQV